MQIFCFDHKTAAAIVQHGSQGVQFSPIANIAANAQVSLFYIEAGGLVGNHQAAADQLFLVVEGTGWVNGAGHERQPITAGHAVIWHAGDWHESGSDTGMTVVVVEADKIELVTWD